MRDPCKPKARGQEPEEDPHRDRNSEEHGISLDDRRGTIRGAILTGAWFGLG
jgi:hypothetical protein